MRPAAVGAVGVLGHDGGREHIVGADADAEHEAAGDEQPDARHEGLRQRRDAEDQRVEAVEAFATLLRQHAEDQRADHRADQRRGGEPAPSSIGHVMRRQW